MRFLTVWFGLVAMSLCQSSMAGSPPAVMVEGTHVVLIDSQGQRMDDDEIIGAELDLGAAGTLRIDGVERDTDARFDEIWLYRLTLRAPGTTLFQPFCAPDPYGNIHAIIYQGFFDEARRYVADLTRFSLSCVSGVEAKCLRWGYLPWRQAPKTGVSLAPYFNACINMARADYCGNDQPSTRNGTAIDIYDDAGVQTSDVTATDLAFEAGWNEAGAVCVAHTRVAENLTMAALHASCPRLQQAPTAADCNDANARTAGALLFNRSKLKTVR